ncbi:PqqD family protein [Natrinema halophilum]|uniref:PqqD family protein n=1 Tax=Natrinema halophilum TaxID=1699371 RepID=A0A7D5KJ10_9EURY|nr:PqqD family protein [Natrinema halophilum]QLG47578.1 PqqD family protein [Natrinema halophilum]
MSVHAPTAVPKRTVSEWTEISVDGELRVMITWTKSPRNRLDRFLFTLFGTNREHELTLDAVGSTVWRQCDGTHTASEIASILAGTYDAERVEPVEETLAYFLMQLEERDLIRFDSE